MQDVTQSEHALESKMIVHHDQTMHARLANRIEDSVQAICQGARVDAREFLCGFV